MSESRHPGRSLAERAAILSIGASAFLHGGIEAFSDEGHGPRVDATLLVAGTPLATEHTTVVDLGTRPHGNPYRTAEAVDETVISPQAQEATRNLSFTGAEYARAFAADPKAGELHAEGVQHVIEIVSDMQAEGYEVTLRVGGTASAEDDSTAADAGVQSESADQKNADLADFRLDSFLNQIEPWLPEGVAIDRLPPIEDTLSGTEVKSLAAMADRFGYENIRELIQHWNAHPDETPPAADALLQELLGNKRGVTGEIIGTRLLPGGEEVVTVSEEVCIQPVLQLKEERLMTEKFEATIPYGVVLFAGGVITGTLFEGIAAVRGRKQRQLESRLRAARVAPARRGSGGAGGGPADEPEPGDNPPTPPTQPPPSTPPKGPESTPPIPPTDPTDKERRRWRWLIPIPFVLAAGGYALQSCLPEAKPPRPATPAPDYCGGLEPQEVVVGEEITEIRNGHRGYPEVTIYED